MPLPRGPTGPLHPRATPMGTFPASQTYAAWGDMLEPSPSVPCGATVSFYDVDVSQKLQRVNRKSRRTLAASRPCPFSNAHAR